MDNNIIKDARTRQLLIEHYQSYPDLKPEDIFKYIYQSAYGCEHLVTDYKAVLEYIKKEHSFQTNSRNVLIEKLNGAYSRVHLSCLEQVLSHETLAKLFCASSISEPDGDSRLQEMISIATALVYEGTLPLDQAEFTEKLNDWRAAGYPATSHSSVFKEKYAPAYRVIANKYACFLQIFSKIDTVLKSGSATVAIEGGSASGKTTLANILKQIYDCNVIHMDDFFLRPEQRTPERFAEVGGNVDRERFAEEVLPSIIKNEDIIYRPFDCYTRSLKEAISLPNKKLTVIEGAYSMHPTFGKYWDVSVFLNIEPEYQRERILKRNSPEFAQRFFSEWIPLENRYFTEYAISKKCDLTIDIIP